MEAFTCPIDCLAGVGEVWSSKLHKLIRVESPVLRIIDIGANVGAFSAWALLQWKEANVLAYEPHPDTFAYLQRNLCDRRASCINAAIGDVTMTNLYVGTRGKLTSTQYEPITPHVAAIQVNVISPSILPKSDIVKIDTEGAEGFIVDSMASAGNLPKLLIVEYHSDSLRRSIELALADKMTLIAHEIKEVGNGNMMFSRC